MNLYIPKEIGYCYGVRQAINKVIEVAQNSFEPIYSYGPLIHNPQAIEELTNTYNIIPTEDINQVHGKTLAIRAHGISPADKEIIENQVFSIIDTTCPFVRKTQLIAVDLVKDGYFVFILGQKKHPEVIGILGHIPDNAIIVQNEADLKQVPPLSSEQKIGIIFQSTITYEEMLPVIDRIKSDYDNVKIVKTICGVTKKRQQAVQNLAKLVQLMIVVGGKNSSNTKKLYESCIALSCDAIKIENCVEILDFDFSPYNKLGLITGTSTPNEVIDEVIDFIKEKTNCKVIYEKENIDGGRDETRIN